LTIGEEHPKDCRNVLFGSRNQNFRESEKDKPWINWKFKGFDTG
jgi:hypothetical protein